MSETNKFKDVKIIIENDTKIFNYKGIEIDRTTWEQAPCPMFCGKITDDNMRQLVIYLYDAMVSVYGAQDVENYVKIKNMLANGESCDYNDIQYYDKMDEFRWVEEENLFNSFGAVYYEDMD